MLRSTFATCSLYASTCLVTLLSLCIAAELWCLQDAVEEPLQQHDGARDVSQAKAGIAEANTIQQPGSAEDASAAQLRLADPSKVSAGWHKQ